MGFVDMVDISTISGQDREPSPRDDSDGLLQDMKQHGQRTPILVRNDLRLIDGLRRIRVLKQFGQNKVEAFVADSWDEIVARIDDARDESDFRIPLIDRPLDIVTMFETVEPLGRAALTVSRGAATRGLKRHERARRGVLVAWRAQFFEKLDMDDHVLSDGRFLLEAMKNIPPGEEEFFNGLYEEVRAGRRSAPSARKTIENYAMHGDILRAEEQARVFNRITHEAEANARAFKTLGSLTGKHTAEELEGWIKAFYEARDQYTTMIKILKRSLGK